MRKPYKKYNLRSFAGIIWLAPLLQSCSLLLGGGTYPSFGEGRQVELVDGLKTEAAIVVDHNTSMGRFRLSIFDPEPNYSSIVITEIEARYKDGVVGRTKNSLSGILGRLPRSGTIGRPRLLYVKEESIAFRHINVTVKFTGYFIASDGRKVDFSATESFRAGRKRYKFSGW